MPNWRDILDEARTAGSIYDVIRRQHLARLHDLTGRNVIIYYSGWLQRPEWGGLAGFSLTDSDKTGFMAAIHRLDREEGLDLVLHTPGGEMAATESLVDYLREMFGTNIRAIVPQLAMSAGTMVALSCREIVMGKHSSLGPIDPQIWGMPAHGVKEEFRRAKQEIAKDPAVIPVWQPIIAKYTPTLIGECDKAVDWANDIVRQWLISGMFEGEKEAEAKADAIINELGDPASTKSHARHISAKRAKEIGIKVVDLEANDELQDAVLSVHHATIQSLALTQHNNVKLVENHMGVAYFEQIGPTGTTPAAD